MVMCLIFKKKYNYNKEEIRSISIFQNEFYSGWEEVGNINLNSDEKFNIEQYIDVKIKPCTCNSQQRKTLTMELNYENKEKALSFYFSPQKYIQDHNDELLCVSPEDKVIINAYSKKAWILDCITGTMPENAYTDPGYLEFYNINRGTP